MALILCLNYTIFSFWNILDDVFPTRFYSFYKARLYFNFSSFFTEKYLSFSLPLTTSTLAVLLFHSFLFFSFQHKTNNNNNNFIKAAQKFLQQQNKKQKIKTKAVEVK
jgi:hypothetical protein